MINWKHLIIRLTLYPPVPMLTSVLYSLDYGWPCGLMDKASVYDTGDCRFDSCQGRSFTLLLNNSIVWFKEYLCLLPNFCPGLCMYSISSCLIGSLWTCFYLSTCVATHQASTARLTTWVEIKRQMNLLNNTGCITRAVWPNG